MAPGSRAGRGQGVEMMIPYRLFVFMEHDEVALSEYPLAPVGTIVLVHK